MSTIPGSHLWAAAVLAPVGFAVGFGTAWAAGHVIVRRFQHARRRR